MKTQFLALAWFVVHGLVAAEVSVLAHYSFDTDYTDSSGNARDGTLVDVGTAGDSGIVTGAGDFRFGGGAMNFSADRDYLAIPSKTFSSGVAYSIAFWARKTAGDTGGAADWDMVAGQRDVSKFFIALNDVTGTGMRWRSSDSSAARQADFAVPKDYDWHHYAIVASGTTITLYLDGTLFGSATGKSTGFIIDTIGEAYDSNSDFDFHGQIDEFWIFDEAIGAGAVGALYSSNNPAAGPPYAGFHHRYDGDYSDSSGAGNHGTPAGGAAIAADPSVVAAGSGALALDGGDGSFVSLPAPGTFSDSEPWTVAWWAKRDTSVPNKGMVIGRASTTTDFIWLNDNFSGLRFRSTNNTTFDFTVPKDSGLRHYALVADGAGGLVLYLDGQYAATMTGSTGFVIDTIGMAYPTTSLHYNFLGSLDEIHVYPSALTATQVAQLYDAGHPPLPVTRVRIVLQAGQSNADGRAAVTDLPTSPVNLQSPQDDIDLFYRVAGGSAAMTTLRPGLSETSGFGPEIALGRRLADLWAGEAGTRVAIVKYANGGTNLAVQWKGGGDATTVGDGPEYVTFQQTVSQGLAALAAAYPAASLELQGMVWLQGESDAVASYASLYQANLAAFIADVRATYGAKLPFVIARLSSGQTALTASYLNQVRTAQDAVAAADPRTGLIATDDLGLNGDNLHFNASAQQAIGARFAGETAYREWMAHAFSAADVDAGLAEPDGDRDGDGRSNRAEFLAATDPLSPVSRLQATVTLSGPGSARISYPSSVARVYQVERLTEPAGTWETALPATRGTGATVERDLGATAPRGLYRVRADLP